MDRIVWKAFQIQEEINFVCIFFSFRAQVSAQVKNSIAAAIAATFHMILVFSILNQMNQTEQVFY